jgi:YD repeat-containing protein
LRKLKTFPANSAFSSWPRSTQSSWSFDRLGLNEAGALTTYVYDAANQLLQSVSPDGVTTYTYDLDGNRTRRPT